MTPPTASRSASIKPSARRSRMTAVTPAMANGFDIASPATSGEIIGEAGRWLARHGSNRATRLGLTGHDLHPGDLDDRFRRRLGLLWRSRVGRGRFDAADTRCRDGGSVERSTAADLLAGPRADARTADAGVKERWSAFPGAFGGDIVGAAMLADAGGTSGECLSKAGRRSGVRIGRAGSAVASVDRPGVASKSIELPAT